MSADRSAAATRYDEALRVVDAYEVQVKTRRATWLAAVLPGVAAAARRALDEAVNQLSAAQAHKQAAWQAWHRGPHA